VSHEAIDILHAKFSRFYMDQQHPSTHFLVRCKRDGEIRVGATADSLRSCGFSPKEIHKGFKKGLLLNEYIGRRGSVVSVILFTDKIDVSHDSLLDKIGHTLRKWWSKLN